MPYQRWRAADRRRLRRLYADTPSKELAELLGYTVSAIHNKARTLGLRNRQHWQPLGSLATDRHGYTIRKMTETGKTCDWVSLHRLLWTEAHGPVPVGHYVRFKDGNKRNITLENLELVSVRENMLRNTIQRYPPELKKTMFLAARVRRKIGEKLTRERREGADEKQTG
ncbi:hypothetical protein LCGC14_2081760 [marine sediment metagenome]|uniref:HNH nuclease domain-containing protein n=1 Tax=marine sediment metagenome TaxID=412755 RepID=A0A0F9HCE2_9ZZZZ